MEDNNVDGRTEEDKTPSESNRKRKVKTPAQLQALEKFYEDHKFPTESLKSEIAKKLGLTEKQVSGWFCHRRLKDKRLAKEEASGNGRMDRSSGVIQQQYSEPVQDSCGSTKPGGYQHGELKEVESQLLTGQEFSVSPMNLPFHDWMNTARLDVDIDDASSESCSPLHPNHLYRRDVPQTLESTKYHIQNGATMPLNSNDVIGTQFRRPTGYLKIKQKTEHPSIRAVKMQLGKNFREYGPPLGIEFQPLPIDAFQSAPTVTNKGPINGTDSRLLNTSGNSCHYDHSRFKMLNATFRPDNSYLEEQVPEVRHGLYSHRQPRPKLKSFCPNNTKLHHEWKPSSNLDRKYLYVSKKDFANGAKYGAKGLPVSSDYRSLCADTLLPTNLSDVSRNISYMNPKVNEKGKHLKNRLSDTKHRQMEPHVTFERRLYT